MATVKNMVSRILTSQELNRIQKDASNHGMKVKSEIGICDIVSKENELIFQSVKCGHRHIALLNREYFDNIPQPKALW